MKVRLNRGITIQKHGDRPFGWSDCRNKTRNVQLRTLSYAPTQAMAPHGDAVAVPPSAARYTPTVCSAMRWFV